MFKFLGHVHNILIILISYRQLQGFLGRLSQLVPELEVPDFTTMWWRVSKMDIPSPPIDTKEQIVIAIDSIGVRVTIKGEWMRKRWGDECRGWIKVHVAVDVGTTEPVAMEITDERTADYKAVPSLIDRTESTCGKVKRMPADGAYYDN